MQIIEHFYHNITIFFCYKFCILIDIKLCVLLNQIDIIQFIFNEYMHGKKLFVGIVGLNNFFKCITGICFIDISQGKKY